MQEYQVYYVGTEAEVAHHAAPLTDLLNVRIATPEEVTRVARPGDLAIFFSEHFHRFRNAWYQLHQAGCHTVYAIDGILEWRNAWETGVEEPACPQTMRPVLSDKVACIGNSQARVLQAWGNHGKPEVTGIPRLDSLLAGAADRLSESPCSRATRILVTTAKWPGYTPAQRDQVRQSLIDLRNYSLRRQDEAPTPAVNWTWRLTGGLAEEVGVENSLADTTGPELVRLLGEVDIVISTPSTVLLESMAMGRPTAILDYTNSPAYVPAAWQITARRQISDVVGQLLEPAPARLAHQQYLLSDALQIGQSASQRMAELCQSMIRLGHDCRAAGRAVEFPARILSPAESSFIPTSIPGPAGNSRHSSSQIEFDALASENRRQLGVLQRRVELLESELTRAAEGFQKIANHPILGPLLKVRQTAIRFGNQIGNALAAGPDTGSDAGNLVDSDGEPNSEPVDGKQI